MNNSPIELSALISNYSHYAEEIVSEHTRNGYARDFARFQAWGVDKGLPTLPTSPEIVAAYLAAMADGKVTVTWKEPHGHGCLTSTTKKRYATISRALSGIAYSQRAAGHDWTRAHPLIVRVMEGIARKCGTSSQKATPLEIDDLRACLTLCRTDLVGIRDKAMLALGFFAALRRSELVALTVQDLSFRDEGIIVIVRKSKTDQVSAGQKIAVPNTRSVRICPVRLTKAWLDTSHIASGPLFRRVDKAGNVGDQALTPQSVGLIIKKLVKIAGLDPKTFSGHSLRAGFVTTAAANGKSLHNIMRQTRHRSERAAMGYIRYGTLWEQNAAEDLA